MDPADLRDLREKIGALRTDAARRDERLERIEDDLTTLEQYVRGLDDGSVRSRLHSLESDRIAAHAAKAAVEAAKLATSTARDRVFSRNEKLIGLCFAGLIALGTIASVVIAAMALARAAHGG